MKPTVSLPAKQAGSVEMELRDSHIYAEYLYQSNVSFEKHPILHSCRFRISGPILYVDIGIGAC